MTIKGNAPPMPPHPLTLRQLQYAVAVADELGFRRAADRCHVAQPSLSAQLAQLEEALGVVLFERGHGEVRLTSVGTEVVARARRLLVDADALIRAAQAATDPLAATLRLGVIPTLSPYLLPSLAPALRVAHPQLTALWVEEKTSTLVRLLNDGQLDAALLALEAPLGPLEHARVARDPFLLAAAASHPLMRRKGPVAAEELRDEEVLLLEDGHCLRDQALAWCARKRLDELAYRATSLTTLTQMVAGGHGVTLLPQLAVETEAVRAGLRTRPLAEPVPGRTIVLAWRPGSAIIGGLQRLAETMRGAYPAPAAPKNRTKQRARTAGRNRPTPSSSRKQG